MKAIKKQIINTMRLKSLLKTCGIIFGLFTIFHALRLLNGWNVEIGELVIPLWVSGIVVAVTALLSYQSFKLSKHQ